MKKILLLIALLLPTQVLANPYNYKVVRVVDGDTVIVEANWLPAELGNTISLRVLGIDTPEKAPRAKCSSEAALGTKATEYAKSLIKPGQIVQVNLKGWDKYGGRADASITINGKDFGQMQIAAGLAKPYDGGTKQSWCK